MRRTVIGSIFLILISLAAAQQVTYRELDPVGTFSIVVTPIRDRIEVNQWAEFSIVVRNHQMQTRRLRYSISEEGVEFSSLTQPTADLSAGFLIEGGSFHTTRYQLKPNRAPLTFSDRPHEVQLHITDVETGEQHSVLLPIWVYPKGYYASQQINLTALLIAPEYLDPRNAYTLRLELQNNNDYDIGLIEIRLEGNIVQRDFTATLGPNANTVLEFPLTLNPQQPPMQDTIIITVLREGLPILRTSRMVSVVEYRIPFDRQMQTEKRFLKRITRITLTNRENVAEEQEILVPTTTWQRILGTVEPTAELVTVDGQQYYRWKQNLQPGEQLNIMVSTSYRLLTLIIAVILFAMLFWYLTKDPVQIIKYAEQHRMFEGGIVELKVILSVRNRTSKTLRHIAIVDKVPSIIAVKEGEHFATLRPHKIVHHKDGTILKWEIEHMDPAEERIITYMLRAKLSILGDIELPPAMAIVSEGNSKAYVKSDGATVGLAKKRSS